MKIVQTTGFGQITTIKISLNNNKNNPNNNKIRLNNKKFTKDSTKVHSQTKINKNLNYSDS